jgi:hypothetical protein
VLLCDELGYCGREFPIKYALLMIKTIVRWTKVIYIYTAYTEIAVTSTDSGSA